MINKTQAVYTSERVSDKFLALNSCGIENLDVIDRGSSRLNGRVDYHILYIERGICRLTLDKREIEVNAGGFVLFKPGEPQVYKFFARDRSVSHYAHFTGTGCRGLLEELGLYDVRVFEMGASRSYEEISAKMAREFIMGRPLHENWCSAYLYELLNTVARKYSLRNSNTNYANEGRINRACVRIYENLANPPSIAELCADSCLSESRFTHLFKQVTGKTVGEFTRFMRMNRAKELLRISDMSVREISEILGYEDQNYFSRIFKAEEGLSPRDYKNGEKQSGMIP